MEKKKYLYGITGTTNYEIWDLLTKDCWASRQRKHNSHVVVYNTEEKKFLNLFALHKATYHKIIESVISHEAFINSPELAIELLKNENEKEV